MTHIVSGLGTVTWQPPRFFVSYNDQTGSIECLGEIKHGMLSFEVSYETAEKFLTGTELLHEYKVQKNNDQLIIVKSATQHIVFKRYPVNITQGDYPTAVITRSLSKQAWIVEKISVEPVFVFVCFENSKRNYIRTLSITESGEYPFIYDSESLGVSLYTNEKHCVIKYQDEQN